MLCKVISLKYFLWLWPLGRHCQFSKGSGNSWTSAAPPAHWAMIPPGRGLSLGWISAEQAQKIITFEAQSGFSIQEPSLPLQASFKFDSITAVRASSWILNPPAWQAVLPPFLSRHYMEHPRKTQPGSRGFVLLRKQFFFLVCCLPVSSPAMQGLFISPQIQHDFSWPHIAEL